MVNSKFSDLGGAFKFFRRPHGNKKKKKTKGGNREKKREKSHNPHGSLEECIVVNEMRRES